ncbi:LacI family DNA-binding transcriptional regulator [Brachybacterium sp. J144]|uniref:LacI family DNA-binding transcriptional regulator n=1 Tax=Brachybacterium sp. J144 TaxID=3116487 RepID=UPI002E7974CD|nr:LacI family DNA-binding transcriptional regulator [Brachybacterium sp. J144]MEE1651027.1 LacI family DNA-binding transcriptional regulator [Brachybacterium sp. J144]
MPTPPHDNAGEPSQGTPSAGSRRRVTLREVAERAGVSRSAASFAMTGRKDQRISAATVAAVRQAAEELGYRPNLNAKALRTGRTGTVGLVSDFISSTSTANALIRGAQRELRAHGALLFTVDTEGDERTERSLLNNLLDRQVDGILYASMFTREVQVPAVPAGTGMVLVNCVPAGDVAIPAVIPDEVGAGRFAAQALLDAGHTSGIHFIGVFPAGVTGGRQWHGWSPLALPDRLAGIASALDAAGVNLASKLATVEWDVSAGRAAVEELLASGVTVKALICVNDDVAAGALQELRAHGLSVPADVSIVSFDDSAVARVTDPPLSSIALPHEQLGRTAAAMLMDPGVRETVVRIPSAPPRPTSIAAPRA